MLQICFETIDGNTECVVIHELFPVDPNPPDPPYWIDLSILTTVVGLAERISDQTLGTALQDAARKGIDQVSQTLGPAIKVTEFAS